MGFIILKIYSISIDFQRVYRIGKLVAVSLWNLLSMFNVRFLWWVLSLFLLWMFILSE